MLQWIVSGLVLVAGRHVRPLAAGAFRPERGRGCVRPKAEVAGVWAETRRPGSVTGSPVQVNNNHD